MPSVPAAPGTGRGKYTQHKPQGHPARDDIWSAHALSVLAQFHPRNESACTACDSHDRFRATRHSCRPYGWRQIRTPCLTDPTLI
jgi:hypothetical protein